MLNNKAFKFKVHPNQKQLTLIHKTFDCVGFAYNYFFEVESLSLQCAFRSLYTIFRNFFQEKDKCLKFKSKRNNNKSYIIKDTNNSIRIENNILKF